VEQSIVTSQANVSPAELPSKDWKSMVAGIWVAMKATKLKIMSNPWLLRNPLGSDISSKLAIDRIAARLAVEQRGRSEGSGERPSTAEEVVAGTQGEIIHYFKQMQRKAHYQVAQLTEKLRGVGKEIDVVEAVGRLRDIPSRCQNEVQRITADFQSQLDFLREREVQQRQHYEAFREENRLSRVAKYPDSPIILYAFMAVLIGVAALALGNTSVSGTDGDIFVPTWRAFSISLLAVVVPFVIGASVFRSINHVRALDQLMAWLTGVITMAFIGGLALFCAFYVAGMAADFDASVRGVIMAIFADPTAISADVAAWKGFGIVSLSGLVAFLVAYWSDDPYPGYGAVQRAYYRARKVRERRTKQLRKQINTIVDVAEVEIAEVTRRMKAQMKQLAALVDKSKRMQAQLGDFEVALEDSCNILLDRYRNANVSARKTEVPMSFSEHVCFQSEDIPAFSMLPTGGKDRLEELNSSIAEVDAEVVQVRQKLRDLNWRAINDLDSALWPADDPSDARSDSSAYGS